MAPLFREPLRGDEQHPGTIGPHLTAPHTRHQPPSSRCYSYRQPPQPRSRESRHFPATAPGRAVGGRLLSRVRRRVVGIGRRGSGAFPHDRAAASVGLLLSCLVMSRVSLTQPAYPHSWAFSSACCIELPGYKRLFFAGRKIRVLAERV